MFIGVALAGLPTKKTANNVKIKKYFLISLYRPFHLLDSTKRDYFPSNQNTFTKYGNIHMKKK
ncbi:hypothetical protein protein [Bacillus cereus G9241]|nr:hypothetical protein protein [Bacillus cereus G9241]